jgi:hypothetical protein
MEILVTQQPAMQGSIPWMFILTDAVAPQPHNVTTAGVTVHVGSLAADERTVPHSIAKTASSARHKNLKRQFIGVSRAHPSRRTVTLLVFIITFRSKGLMQDGKKVHSGDTAHCIGV